jgi:hypothetical protein
VGPPACRRIAERRHRLTAPPCAPVGPKIKKGASRVRRPDSLPRAHRLRPAAAATPTATAAAPLTASAAAGRPAVIRRPAAVLRHTAVVGATAVARASTAAANELALFVAFAPGGAPAVPSSGCCASLSCHFGSPVLRSVRAIPEDHQGFTQSLLPEVLQIIGRSSVISGQ